MQLNCCSLVPNHQCSFFFPQECGAYDTDQNRGWLRPSLGEAVIGEKTAVETSQGTAVKYRTTQVWYLIWESTLVIWYWKDHYTKVTTGHGVSNHWQFDYFFSCLFRLTRKRTSKLHFTCPLWGKSTSNWSIPNTYRTSYVENVSMWFHYHGQSIVFKCSEMHS